jgi:hypothetical protein
MRKSFRTLLIVAFMLTTGLFSACPKPPVKSPNPPDGTTEKKAEVKLGRLMFDTPVAFTDVGTIDLPRLIQPQNGQVQLVYLLMDGQSQRIMFMSASDGVFGKASYLSEDEGSKPAGAFLTSLTPDDFLAYWVNIPVTGGQLLFKESSNSGKTFTMERQWNNRNEVRWPCVLPSGKDIDAFFFVHSTEKWELAINKNYSSDPEQTIDVAEGTPFHLQGVADGGKNIWLAYFVRVEKSDGGKIAMVTSQDSGATFSRTYLFADKVIPSVWSFIDMVRSVNGSEQIIHLIYTEDTPDLTTLYYSKSVNGGEFSEPVAMLKSENPLTRSPLIVANGKYVVIVSADTEDDGPAVRYLFSEDGGKTFDQPSIATRKVSNPETLTGAVDSDGRVILAWDDIAEKADKGECLYLLKATLRGK